MLVQAAETRFQRGLQALETSGRNWRARALRGGARARAAARLRTPQARYLSLLRPVLGAETRSQLREGAEFCRQAIALEFFNADLFWNYGRVPPGVRAAARRRSRRS